VILCHCRGVNDRKVRKAIDKGARSLDEIAEACDAGTDCGGCLPALAELLAARTGQQVEQADQIQTIRTAVA
jgi:bacterioferritin-associated ferredoxin